MGVPLANVVRQHVKVVHTLPGYDTYLKPDEEMIARSPIDDARLYLKQTQNWLDTSYVNIYCNMFKIDNSLVYHILVIIFMDMNLYVYMKQRKSTQNSWTLYFDISKQFLSPDHVASLATETKRKLQNSHNDWKKKG